jgi:hypothetical protein
MAILSYFSYKYGDLGPFFPKKKLLCMSHSPFAFVTKWQNFITKENTGSGVQNWFEIEEC